MKCQEDSCVKPQHKSFKNNGLVGQPTLFCGFWESGINMWGIGKIANSEDS